MKQTTKSHDEMIREEAILLRRMVHKARRRERVLKRYRQAPSGRMHVRFRRNSELVGAEA